MPIDRAVYKVMRAVKGGGERRCPHCKRERLFVVEKMDERRTGVLCANCGWGRGDLKSERINITCEGDACGEQLGPLEIVEGRPKVKKYICADCAKKRREAKVEADSEGTMVRYKMLCEAGCGTQTLWHDFPETEGGPPKGKLRGHFCKPCALKQKPKMLRNTTDQKIIFEAAEELRKKREAGQPITREDVFAVVDRLMKAKPPAPAPAEPAPSTGS